MKRLFYLIVIIVLPILLFFQWKKYRRFNPPMEYSYPVNDSIDANYHDPGLVLTYYQAAEATGSYARYCWRKERIDVRYPNLDNPKEATAARTYQQHVATTQSLERKLLQSAKWKAQGMSNKEIQVMEGTGMNPTQLSYANILGDTGVVRLGAEGAGVWHIQRLLIQKGFEIRLDGIFDQETLAALNAFQLQDSLRQTYGVDQNVLQALMNE